MDGKQFDALTRLLQAIDTRRGALGLLGGALGLPGIAETAAGKRKKKRKKRRKKNVCAGKNTCAKTAFCDARAECACFVPEGGGKSFCGSAFPRTVGSCNACGPGETCVNLDGPGAPCNFFGLACVTRCPNGK